MGGEGGRRDGEARDPVFGVDPGSLRHQPLSDLGIRFAFGAAISAMAGAVAVLAGSKAGGLLLAFPAILPATLTLVEKEETERKAEDLDVGSILGAASLAAFAALVWTQVEGWAAPVVLALATLAWLSASVLLYLGLRLLRREHGSSSSRGSR